MGRNRRFRRLDAKFERSRFRLWSSSAGVSFSQWVSYSTSKNWAWSMLPISHYVRLILSHGVQMCSFFSIICCERLENASRYTISLTQLNLVMNNGYLDFDGPSQQSQSVSRAKTPKTLKCTFWSKIGLFGGFGKYSGKALLTSFFSLAKPMFIGWVSKQTF